MLGSVCAIKSLQTQHSHTLRNRRIKNPIQKTNHESIEMEYNGLKVLMQNSEK